MTKEELLEKNKEYEIVKNNLHNELQDLKRDYAEEHSIFKKGDTVLYGGVVLIIEGFTYSIENNSIFCIYFVIAKRGNDNINDSLVIYEKSLKKHE